MSEIKPVITDVGLAAILNSQGLQGTLKYVVLGDVSWTPDVTATSLKNQRREIPITGYQKITDHQIHLTAVEDGNIEYQIREIGFLLEDRTLLAVWSHATQPLAYKSIGTDVLLAFDLILEGLPANSVTVDASGTFELPPATEDKRGMIELATQEEVDAGTDVLRAVTPAKLNNMRSADQTTRSIIRTATQAETNDGSLDTVAVSPKTFVASKSDAVNVTSSVSIATSTAVKTAYDAAVTYATTGAQGQVKLATNAETLSGTDGTKSVTPSSLASIRKDDVNLANSQYIATAQAVKTTYDAATTYATTSAQGQIRLATQADTNTGTSTTIAVSPATLKSANLTAPNLRAQATTKADVGLGNVQNYGITDSITSTSSTTYASAKAVSDAYNDSARTSGTYSGLRAQATTQADVGLGNVKNYGITDSVTTNSSTTYASAKAVRDAYADSARTSGTYSGLRAQATTKDDVGLGNLPNAKSDSATSTDSNTLATSKAVYNAVYLGAPVGAVIAYAGGSAPDGWLECNGQSTSGYTALRSLIGNNVPDLRGEFIRGWDNTRGIDSGRGLRTFQNHSFESHNHEQFTGTKDDGNFSSNFGQYPPGDSSGRNSRNLTVGDTGGTETRPRNIALMYIIKY